MNAVGALWWRDVLLAWILLIIRVIRVAWDGGNARRVQELEARVQELENRN